MQKIRKNLGPFLKRHKSVLVRRTILTLLIFPIAWITILKIEKVADIILETGPLKDAYTAVFTPLVEPSRRDSSHSTSQPPSQDQSEPLSDDDGSENAPTGKMITPALPSSASPKAHESTSLKDGSGERLEKEIRSAHNPAAKLVPDVLQKRCEKMGDSTLIGDEEQIKKYSSFVSRGKSFWDKEKEFCSSTLSLKLAGGKHLDLENVPGWESKRVNFFVDYLQEAGLYLVDILIVEGQASMLISDKNGQINYLLPDNKIVSPNGKKLLSFSPNVVWEYSPSGIEIWRISDSVATREFRINPFSRYQPVDGDSRDNPFHDLPWSARLATWKDDDTIVFIKYGFLGGDSDSQDIGLSCIKYDGQKWNLLEGDKETLPIGC